MSDAAPRGLVLGLGQRHADPLGFWALVDEQSYLQLDDVVAVESALPDGVVVTHYGIVDGLEALHENVSYASDVRQVANSVRPARTIVQAHVSVTRVEPEIYVPPMPGRPLTLADGAQRDAALFFDRMEDRFALGLSRTSATGRATECVYGNLAFLDGTQGGHVNISGVSGVATKTSYATFLLYSLFETDALGPRRSNAKAVIFNVKGESLLFLDRESVECTDGDHEAYARLGITPGAFRSVAFWAPCRPGQVAAPDTATRSEGVSAYYWTLREFCERGYLRFLFVENDRESSQVMDLAQFVADRLEEAARDTPFASREGDVFIEPEPGEAGDGWVRDDEELQQAIRFRLEPGGPWSTRSNAAPGTIQAFLRRMRAGFRHVGPLVRGAAFAEADDHRLAFQEQVTVVDINRLHDRAQRFVVGVVLDELVQRASGASVGPRAPQFVVLDELNKYAPRDGRSPIKEVLLDIAERGRSLGIILIGAQQTASEVEPRVIANASFRVVGRLDGAEAGRAEYGFLTPSARARAVLLKPGSMLVSQPEIPVPLLVEFPHPSWATDPKHLAAPVPSSRLLRFDDVDPAGYDD